MFHVPSNFILFDIFHAVIVRLDHVVLAVSCIDCRVMIVHVRHLHLNVYSKEKKKGKKLLFNLENFSVYDE